MNNQFPSPKRARNGVNELKDLYPYYAGFSTSFATTTLQMAQLQSHAKILDPWNGSGTTTACAANLGLKSSGFDLNPVMTLVSKTRTFHKGDKNSIIPLSEQIASVAMGSLCQDLVIKEDPLMLWFGEKSVVTVRKFEMAIQQILVSNLNYQSLSQRPDEDISVIAAFFYVALFRSVRTLLKKHLTSNPTWIKIPKADETRLGFNVCTFSTIFKEEVMAMYKQIDMMPEGFSPDQSADIRTASSTNLPIDDSVIDFVLTSPPYCTRIDYAVATLPELCIMGYGIKSGFDNIRRSLIGACTVPKQPPAPKTSWGKTCLKLVENISSHTTKAAKTYYLKNHLQYFDGLFNSIGEIARVTKPSAKCAIVVQDSYFKDVHNDLPMIFIEMAEAHSLHFKQRYDFPQTITMGSVNRGTSLYRGRHNITESVLFFENRKVPNYESRCRYRRSIPD